MLLFCMFFALCSEIKEKIKKTKDENKAEVMAKQVTEEKSQLATQGPQGW